MLVNWEWCVYESNSPSVIKRPKARKCLSCLNALENAILTIGSGVKVLEKVFLKKWVNWGFVAFIMENTLV